MTQALTAVPAATPAPRDLIAWTEEQVTLIQRTVAKDCTADEFKLFLYQCRRTGLDPLAKQIYAVKRAGRMTIQTGIDGFRLTADRTRALAGSDDPAFKGTPKTDKFEATVTVYKAVGGMRCPFTATARWSEYFPGEAQGAMWKKMPHAMLGKCAEALALRKAFPADLSGLYTTEEMAQAGGPPIIDVTPTVPAVFPAAADRADDVAPCRHPPDEFCFVCAPGDHGHAPDAAPADGGRQSADGDPEGHGDPAAGPEIPTDDTAKISLLQRKRMFGIAKANYGPKGTEEVRAAVQRVTGQTSTEDLRQRQYDRVVAILEAK